MNQLYTSAFIFALISVVNFFLLTPSFFTIFTGIATALVAAFSLFMAIMIQRSPDPEAQQQKPTQHDPE